MIRSVIKRADWTLSVDQTPGASGPIFELECTSCDEGSGPSEDRATPEMWALRHTGRHPGHRGYRAQATAFFRVDPAPGNPLHEAPVMTCASCQQPILQGQDYEVRDDLSAPTQHLHKSCPAGDKAADHP